MQVACRSRLVRARSWRMVVRGSAGEAASCASRGTPDGSGGIVAAGGALWVSDELDAALDRIDRRAGRVTSVVPIGLSPQSIAADGSAPAVITDAHAPLTSLARHRLARARSQRSTGSCATGSQPRLPGDGTSAAPPEPAALPPAAGAD